MSADRISTSGQVVMQSETIDTNINSGNGTTRIYTGPKASLVNQRVVEIAYGASMTKLESTADGNYKLTAGFSFDVANGSNSEPPANVHDLDISMSQVAVWNSDVLRAKFAAAFGSVAGANAGIGYAARLVDSYNHGEFVTNAASTGAAKAEAKINTDYPVATYPAQNAIQLNAFRGAALRGIENCIQFDSIYRRRITAASYNQVQAAFTGKGKIWTTAEVVSFENVPSSWWFQLPADYLWLKAAPHVSTVAGGKTEITYNYLAVAEAWGLTFEAYNAATLLNF